MNKVSNKALFFRFESLIMMMIGVICFAVYFFNQQPTSIETSPLLDAHQYIKSYLYFNGNLSEYKVNFPFNTRIAIPALAALIPSNEMIYSFSLVHLLIITATFFIVGVIHKALNLSLIERLIIWFFLLFHWLSPIRFTHHEPFQTDSACYLIFSLFVLILVKQELRWLYLLAPISVLFKEVLPPLLIIAFIHSLFTKDFKNAKHYISAFIISMVVLYGLRMIFPPSIEHWHHHGAITILRVIKMIVLRPTIVITWFAALVSTFGILILFNKDLRTQFNSLWFWLLMGVIALGLIAGGDHSRIIFPGIIFLIPIFSWYPTQKKELILLTLLSIPFFHLFSSIPNITSSDYRDWFTEYASNNTITMILSYAAGVFFFLKVARKVEF